MKTDIEILSRVRQIIEPAQKRVWDYLEGLGDADQFTAVDRAKMMVVIGRAMDEANQQFLRTTFFTAMKGTVAGRHPLEVERDELKAKLASIRGIAKRMMDSDGEMGHDDSLALIEICVVVGLQPDIYVPENRVSVTRPAPASEAAFKVGQVLVGKKDNGKSDTIKIRSVGHMDTSPSGPFWHYIYDVMGYAGAPTRLHAVEGWLVENYEAKE